ncbi:MAG: hypothetical protein JRI23_22585, partial [Deltaproteobacteria bacterium]|nr:hypothetical protein [Deltaproteobacteria bacterium]MBW2534749.1 hypothetical protein [Deltaproteobacteria bacterium]
QATIVDAPYGVSNGWLYPSTWSQSPTRIKWQITEDLLLGRMTYEHVDNANNLATGAATTDGQVVVAYRISSHFDIRRGYNPSTGEELNVIEENQSDRPWYEREYFRVDWSENLQADVYDFDTLSMQSMIGGVTYTPLAYYVNDPTDPDAPFFDAQGGYFDVTNKVYASPGMIDLSAMGWGVDAYPACWLPDEFFGGDFPVASCNPSEITVRHGFRRVVDTDYEPADWDGWKFQGWGAFVKERMGYTRKYGMTDDRWYRFITRYNIWERSHFYGASCGEQDFSCMNSHSANMTDPVECFTPETTPYGEDPTRDEDGNGTQDECEIVTTLTGVAGSKCDRFKQKCTLPFRLRTPKPLPWYYTNGSNPEYFDGTEWATHNWDVALRKAVQVARYSECRNTMNVAGTCGLVYQACGCDAAGRNCANLSGPECVYDLDGSGSVSPEDVARACDYTMQGECAGPNPVFFGQQDDNLEALQLAQEVDDCRHGLSYPDFGTINSAGREAACVGLAQSVADLRSNGGARLFDPGVINLAQMPEMIVLCHSPVEADDPEICAPSHERLPAGYTAEMCDEAEETRDAAVLPICRAARYARRGDLRYHLVNAFEEPHSPSSWGIYTDAEDPLTGETFSAAINTWTHINDLWSQMVIDRIRFVKGEIDIEDVTEAEYVHNYSQALEAARKGGVAGRVDKQELRRRIGGMTGASVEEVGQMLEAPDNAMLAGAKQLKAELQGVMFAVDAPSTMAPIYEARRQAAIGTEVEASLMNRQIQQLGGVEGMPIEGNIMDYASPLRGLHPGFERKIRQMKQQAIADHGSCILTMNDAPAPMAMVDFSDILEQKFANMCIAREDLDDACTSQKQFTDVAFRQICGPMRDACAAGPGGGCTCADLNGDAEIDEMELDACCAEMVAPWHQSLCVEGQAQNPDACLTYGTFSPDDKPAAQVLRGERMRVYMAQRVHHAVTVHEMGHSIGQRHNFVSSGDAWGYRPQYWQLRTKNGRIKQRCGCPLYASLDDRTCEEIDATGEECVGPRYFDPVTENEANNMIWAWQQESVMDYAGEHVQDMLGLAVWDYACATLYYGDSVAVFDDPSYKIGQPRASGMLSKMDNFGGILGLQPSYAGEDIHYSSLNEAYELIKDCQPVDPTMYRPAAWNPAKDGIWHPVLDGLIVSVEGEYSKCRQQRVDYVPWERLHIPTGNETYNVPYYRAGGGVDHLDRVRVPYGFASDRWADLGNASVYRHDNGADVYEIFNWLATQQEINHIFDAYRRGRMTFSVRSAANRILGRYNEKIRDGAKGLGLMSNVYRDFAAENNFIFDEGYSTFIFGRFFPDNILASSMVFDHFVRTAVRPEAGPHYEDDYLLDDTVSIMRSDEDTYKASTTLRVLLPNGATGAWGNVAPGAKLLENRLCEECGEFDADFTQNAGSYYDKINTAYLMTESVDNFISDSRGDFLDGRYRAVSLADLFPDGYRRWLSNMLTLDEELKGPRLVTNATGAVDVDENKYPAQAMGWPSYWAETPSFCFPSDGTTVCRSWEQDETYFDPRLPQYTVAVDSQVDWEVQKFLINWTLLYLPENEKQQWVNLLRMWELGVDADPEFANRIEFHDPYGKVFVAKSFGTEEIFGRTVQKGIAARVLEYANLLLNMAYVTDCDTTVNPEIDPDGDGVANWCLPVLDTDGNPIVRFQEGMEFILPAPPPTEIEVTDYIPGCGLNPATSLIEEDNCPCSANRACVLLEKYVTLPYYMRQTLAAYGIVDPEMRGVYE